MERAEKSWEQIFAPEIALIKDEELKSTMLSVFLKVEQQHKTVPASSTGKYHPVCSNGPGGLIRHTKLVVWLTEDLLRARPDLSDERHDEFIVAAILHDMGKYHGGALYVTHDHPKWIADLCREQMLEPTSIRILSVASLIEPHMGIWNKNNKSEVILPVPSTEPEWLLHYADYIASRKWITYTFDEEDNIVL